jgi:NDP-sugar pyrophosphorylase family protein
VNDDRFLVLAGGISSRMRRASPSAGAIDPGLLRDADLKSKAMIGVGEGNRPFLDYLLFNARAAGYRDVVIVVGERDEAIREYYGRADRDNDVHGLRVSYAVQPIPAGRTKPAGTADAVLRALNVRPDWHGGSFTVCNSDNLYSIRALELMRTIDSPCAMIDYDRAALEFEQSRIEQFALIRKDAEGYLIDIVEKPDAAEVARMADDRGRVGVSMNIFRLSAELILPFLEVIPMHPVRNEKELPVAVRMMIAVHPRSVRVVPLSEHVLDLTNRDDIPRVQEVLRRTYPQFTLEQPSIPE